MTTPLSRRPRWAAARNEMLTQIGSGRWPPGQRIPAEPALAQQLGVSRATLREALRSLAEEGYIVRRPGAGTRVAPRVMLPASLDNNVSVAEIIRSMGMVPGTSSLQFRLDDAPDDVARDLALGGNRQVAVIDRVRTADGEPVVLTRHFYAPRDGWDAGAMFATLDADSIYTLLETRAGIRIGHATAVITPARAAGVLAERLDVPEGELLLHFRQVDFDLQTKPVMLSSEYYRAAAFRFTIFRRGPRHA